MPDEAALTAIADRVFDGLNDVEEGAARGVEGSEGIEVTQPSVTMAALSRS